jgi:hypothetical protein
MCEILQAEIFQAFRLCEKRREERKEKKKQAKEMSGDTNEETQSVIKSSGGRKWHSMFYFWEIADAVENLRGMSEKMPIITLLRELNLMVDDGIILTSIDYSPGNPPCRVFERR